MQEKIWDLGPRSWSSVQNGEALQKVLASDCQHFPDKRTAGVLQFLWLNTVDAPAKKTQQVLLQFTCWITNTVGVHARVHSLVVFKWQSY